MTRPGPRGHRRRRNVAGELLDRWQGQSAERIRHMPDGGEIAPTPDADREAAALSAGIRGGVPILPTTGGTARLEAALDPGIAHLRTGDHRDR